MRESGSGTQQMFEQALQGWGIDPSTLIVELVLASSEMVKAVVESGSGAAAISEMMIQKELQLGTLYAVQVMNEQLAKLCPLEITQAVVLLKHRQRFQTKLAIAFSEMLTHSQMSVVT
jgi:DNA-binding transcriptional LysR family regulator